MRSNRRRRARLSSALAVLLLAGCSAVVTDERRTDPSSSGVAATSVAATAVPGSVAGSSASTSVDTAAVSTAVPVVPTPSASAVQSVSVAATPVSSSVVAPPIPVEPARLFTNPVVTTDFPDPSVLQVGGMFYLYGTRTRGVNLQVQSSPNLIDWTAHPDPLPVLGAWALPNKTWAPEVTQVGDLSVMFYTAWDEASGRQCIGRAVASSPIGPFVDDSTGPFVCQLDLGGSIDANPVITPDGSRFLYWKSDGNCCGVPVGLWGQAMNASRGRAGRGAGETADEHDVVAGAAHRRPGDGDPRRRLLPVLRGQLPTTPPTTPRESPAAPDRSGRASTPRSRC